jgi:6,7-dimethyl-8-ribityllumazine synthase
MSGMGTPDLDVSQSSGLRVCVIAASWHSEVMTGLIRGADRGLEEGGIVGAALVRVPGAFELPVAAMKAARSGRFDAVITLGVVIRGGTPHFDYVCHATSAGLMDVTTQTGVPVGFGLLTCDTEAQALDRAGFEDSAENKGYEAATAALVTAVALRDLP